MATNRFGYSDDFVLKNGKVGINTAEPQEKLDVVGVVKGQDLKVTGVSSFTTYEGFLEANHTIDESITLTSGTNSSLSGEIIVGTGVTVTIANVGLGTTTVGIGTNQTGTNTIDTDEIVSSGQGGIDSLKVYNTFTVPTGGTEDRPIKVKPGQLYYNVDFKTIEFWDGNNWRQVDNTTRSGRGVIASGNGAPLAATFLNSIEFINIASTGNSLNFGDITSVPRQGPGGCSSSTRGLFGGGYNGPVSPGLFNNIDYITIQSEGNSIDFGDLTISVSNRSACSSSTRGVWGGGANPTNVIEYVEIGTLGNSIDFGDLSLDRQQPNAFSSPTRGIFGGGIKNPAGQTLIDFITIASKGNAVKFGDLTQAVFAPGSCSNSVRGLFGGGSNPTSLSNIDYVTIASEGNAIRFGDLTQARNWGGGVSTQTNVIDFVNIATTGNAQDFGDLSIGRQGAGSCSDSHGGLGGF
jgi:hypothetical protein